MAAGVSMGAFGAHAWKAKLVATGRAETYETGIRYLMIHALALVICGLLVDTYPRLRIAAGLMAAGVLFFSGSLITLALSNTGWWGAVAPVGGTAFVAGWLTAAWAVMRS